MRNQRTLAYLLIGLGVFSLLIRNGGADWLWLALLSVIFLFAYVSRQSYGFLIAGGVLMGVAVGSLIGSQGGMLLSLAAGFYAIDTVERRPNRWPYYTAGILAVLGVLSALGSLGILGSVGFALLLVAGGVYLLYRERETGNADRGAGYSSVPTSSRAPASPPSSPNEPVPAPTTEAATPEPVTDAPSRGDLETAEVPSAVSRPITSKPETPPTSAPTAVTSTATPRTIDPETSERLARLEGWRRETAAAAGTPSYIIFSNDTLFRIASANPQTLEELDKIRGVGPVKLERYGSAVLTLLQGAGAGDDQP